MSVSEDRIYELINNAECGAIASSIITAIYEATQAERARCARVVQRHIDGVGRFSKADLPTEIVEADYRETLQYIVDGLEPQGTPL